MRAGNCEVVSSRLSEDPAVGSWAATSAGSGLAELAGTETAKSVAPGTVAPSRMRTSDQRS